MHTRKLIKYKLFSKQTYLHIYLDFIIKDALVILYLIIVTILSIDLSVEISASTDNSIQGTKTLFNII